MRRASFTGRACAAKFPLSWPGGRGQRGPKSDAISSAVTATAENRRVGEPAIASRSKAVFALEKAVALQAARFNFGDVRARLIWRLSHTVRRIEFWTDKPFRLHERLHYSPSATGGRLALREPIILEPPPLSRPAGRSQ